ncbi:hypothetical protein M413DRAFT_21948 [Hebeloma cylindrosporum]|uniref:DUF6534 domain-containing protein n=1 Tax=Hebeloma cylindrosporum TaxID=76867 RepID=A0A0C3D112_HEBCY|nr:hypothetical protein M413DRAFT_21948 [Hebeloma cylindrosporum h7]
MDPNAPPFVAPQELSKLSGPQLLTVLLKSGLIGVLSVQESTDMYSLAFPKDRVYMRCLVYGVYFLQLVQSVLVIKTGYWIFVTSFGDVAVFDRIDMLWLSVPVISSISTCLIQGFYAHRISILAQSKKMPGVIVALSFIQLGGGIAVGVHAQLKKFYSLLDTPQTVVLEATSTIMWNIGSVLCDTLIAVCMTYYLSRFDTTIRETKIMTKKIIRLTIETGSLTAAIAIVCLSLVLFPPGTTYYYQVPMGIIGNVYANSMLLLINSRIQFSPEKMPQMVISTARFGTCES